ncbi:MAG TPA: winged helix-turn-helix domain-containing protein [Pyrinomonadaceae bacterium]|nr:winged helix-turn-helix domain-containing protein [Pyrinomonadaceae bacterium]
MNNNQERYFEFGEFRLDTIDHVLLCRGEKIPLTHKAFHLLLTLVENKGHLLKHKELMNLVWQETAVDQSSLKQNIALLRKALGDTSEEPKFIQTLPKYGYRFIAPVTTLYDENPVFIAQRQTITQIDIEEEFTNQPKILKASPLGSRNFLFISILGLTTLLGFLFFIFFRNSANPPKTNPFTVNNIVISKLTEVGNIVRGILSPNGEFVVYNTYEPNNGFALWVRRLESKDSIQLVAPSLTERPEAFTVTNDGNWVYYVTTQGDWGKRATLYRISILGGKPRKITEHLDSFVSFSPDDKQMIFNRFSEQGCQLITANALDGSNEKIIGQGKTNKEFLDPKWSPDGKNILFYNLEHRIDGNYWTVSTISVENSQITPIIPPDKQKVWSLGWTNDGNIVMNAQDPITKLGQIYTVSYPDGKMERSTNDLFNYLGVSFGKNSIISTKTERISNLWVSEVNSLNSNAQKISTGFFDTFEWTNDGKIIFVASNGAKRHLWKMNADGTNKEQISPEEFDELLPDLSPDTQFMTFISNRGGTYEIWISNVDGSHPKQLTSGNPRVWNPKFAPNGKSVYFEYTKNENTFLANISIEGGQMREIVSDSTIFFYDISPDGKSLAYSFQDKSTEKVKLAIRSLISNEFIKQFDEVPSRFLKFGLDGKSLIFKNSEKDAASSSVWIQQIEGGNPRQLVDFKQDEVYWIDYSPDGKYLANLSGKPSSDLILLKALENSH